MRAPNWQTDANFFVIPGLTRYPVEKVRLSGGTLFDWIPAFAGMTTVQCVHQFGTFI